MYIRGSKTHFYVKRTKTRFDAEAKDNLEMVYWNATSHIVDILKKQFLILGITLSHVCHIVTLKS